MSQWQFKVVLGSVNGGLAVLWLCDPEPGQISTFLCGMGAFVAGWMFRAAIAEHAEATK